MTIQPKKPLTRSRILQIVAGVLILLVGLVQLAHGLQTLSGAGG